ncbi:MAG: SRPBCC family protein [Myxococcota bacterium]
MNSDRIEKKLTLKADLARVWKALSDAKQFGEWFGIVPDGAFTPGARLKGRLTYPKYEHVVIDMVVAEMKPMELFSYRWHPYAVDMARDYSKEEMTLVEFKLRRVEAGTELVVIESGFDKVPLERRAEALRMNDGGWAGQMENIERYVTKN